MKRKSLGVIGGMGPLATSVFFERVIANTVASADQEHINMVILNHATLPDRTSAILNNQEDAFLDEVAKDIQLLEHAGVGHIAIPCNTSHYFYKYMQAMTTIPIINMVEETCKSIQEHFGKHSKVALLATNGTVETRIYEHACQKYELEYYSPKDDIQQQVMNTIYNIKSNYPVDAQKLENLIRDLIVNENCQCVILACTELSCLKLNDEIRPYTVDAMDVLVQKSIQYSGGLLKE